MPGPRAEFFAGVDAANVDLKAFSDDFYHRLAAARLEPVLDTLKYLRRETEVWLEITTLLIPGENDSPEEIDALTRWVADELGAETPLHFSAFHPDYRLLDHPPTPKATLMRARDQGRANGLKHVYVGNVRDRDGETTYLRRLRRAADPARRLRDRSLWARRPGRVPALRNASSPAASRPRPAPGAIAACRSTSGPGRNLPPNRERKDYTNIALSRVTQAIRCSQTARMRPRPRVSWWVTSQ